jgi:adenylylsulfate kinase/bifunctional enzyme CysN/CysC
MIEYILHAMQENIHPSKFRIKQKDRLKIMNQKPVLIWFTGLSGSGKSTLANGTEVALHRLGYKTYLLDGDNVRCGLNSDLKFTIEDRMENIRRIAEVSKLMMDAGLVVLAAFITPLHQEREMIKNLVGVDNFLEVFVDCPLTVCEKRDVKGLYEKARKGMIPNFTGITSPYEPPENPFIRIKSNEENTSDSIKMVVNSLINKIQV